MAVDEMLKALRRDLERDYGMEAAAYLMDRPRGGWDALVTNETLGLNLEAVGQRLHSEIAELRGDVRAEIAEVGAEIAGLRAGLRAEMRQQTWRLATLVIAAQGVVVAAIVAAAAVVRFA